VNRPEIARDACGTPLSRGRGRRAIMRPPSLAVTLAAVAVATGAAARDLPRAPAESDASYVCRAELTPASRSCLARCDAASTQAAQDGERWACVQGCTTEHVRAVRACREEAMETARANVPHHDAEDDDRPIAFDPARLSD
jgi:hypothetical protein